MTPQECKNAIAKQYEFLKERKVGRIGIYHNIMARCQEAQRHNCNYHLHWSVYAPEEYKEEYL